MLTCDRLFNIPEFSDVTIKAGAREIRCHKIILCNKSEYFKSMCGPDSKFKEKNEQLIELVGDDERAAEALLRHLYNFTYAETEKAIGDFTTETHMHVVAAAQKYMLPALETSALDSLESAVAKIDDECRKSKNVSQVFDVLKLLPSHAGHHQRIADQIKRLVEHNFALLFKLREFRELLDTKPWSRTLEQCIKTLDSAFVGASKKRLFYNCTCNMVWAADCNIKKCPNCERDSSSYRTTSKR